jgi:hypothetical protein
MKNITVFILLILFISCEDEKYVTCIAESEQGKIIETRSTCNKSTKYLKGFTDGFKDKHEEATTDSVYIHCTYTN